MKHFFLKKKKKVIEGQAGAITYYRIDFPDTFSSTPQDLLKELILTQYDASKIITDTTGIQYVKFDAKYTDDDLNWLKAMIPATLFMKDSNDAVLGLKVAGCTGNKLDFFNMEAAAAADTADATAAAAAAAAAYDYARLILSNDATYKTDADIMALIAAANLLTIIGQPTITNYTDKVVTDAKAAAKSAALAANSGSAADAAEYADYAADYAAKAAADAKTNVFYGLAEAADALKAAEYAANAAGYADAYAKGQTLDATAVKLNDNYKKVMNKDNSTPANMKAAFITAAGLIYQSIYEKIKPPL